VKRAEKRSKQSWEQEAAGSNPAAPTIDQGLSAFWIVENWRQLATISDMLSNMC